jgi:hypothetical protein
MKTKLITLHEEQYTDGSKTLGVLINYSDSNNSTTLFDFKESFTYIYKEGMYIFFNTMIDLIDYLLYGEKEMKRAYMEETVFDKYYGSIEIEGKFTDILTWE